MGNLSIINDMALRYGMEKAEFEETLINTIIPATEKAKATPSQVAAFLLVAKEYDLNPFTKEIYAFPARGGGIQPIVSVDGWLKIINGHPQFDGMQFEDHFDDRGGLSAITCTIYRKDRKHPIIVTEYMAECRRGTDTWKNWPARMLRHKATIQGGRYAFGFSGIIDPDEAERIIDMGEASRDDDPKVKLPQSKSKSKANGNGNGKAKTKPAETMQTDEPPPQDEQGESAPTQSVTDGKTITDGQVRVLRKKLESSGINEADLCTHYEIGAIEELAMSMINSAIKWANENGHTES